MHDEEVSRLQKILQNAARPATLQKGSSNTCRENAYKQNCSGLSLGSLDRVLKVDPEKRVAVAEPGVTMEKLVKETLRYGLVPAVVPEFRSITVGGAVNGAALESSSHIFGQFNDSCLAYELILGDGVKVFASPQENPDLFYGISGSYGTLGVLVSADIALVPAPGWVLLRYHRFDSLEKAVAFMSSLHRREDPPEFLEAIVYQENIAVVIEGRMASESEIPEDVGRFSLSKSWSIWFYQHVLSRSKSAVFREAFPVEDYLFRHDRNAFWMGGYALNPRLLLRYILELTAGCPDWLHKKLLSSSFTCRKKAGPLFRFLFGWMMGSERLFRFMHHGTEKWFAEHFCIQDYYLPENKTVEFASLVLQRYGITPLWLCPVRAAKGPQLLSPHFLNRNEGGLLFDVGVYGMAASLGAHPARELDRIAPRLGGRKMLYSSSDYTPEEFWEIYSKNSYNSLRKKYAAEKSFPDITNKVL